MNQLDQIQQRLGTDLTRMNEIIRDSLATPNPLMNEVVTNYLRQKGKQIRPILVMLAARMFGGVNDAVMLAAAALEMLHNASLIHDDVVDETALRRGRPTINFSWGNHMAVLVGDFFVSNALAVGVRTGSLAMVKALSDLGIELSIGEVDQISNASHHNFDEESYYGMIGKKTASLFVHCVHTGAIGAGATPQQAAPLDEYARLLGLCFQVKDDIFDYYDSAVIGKPTGNDLREGKMTLPLLHALKAAPTAEGDANRELLRRGDLSDDEIAGLIDFAKRYGGIEYAEESMRRMRTRALEALAGCPAGEARDTFAQILDFIIERDR